MTTREIKEGVRISGPVNLGAGVTVEGNGMVEGSLRVKGCLEAASISGFLKGLFPTTEALRRAYPFPRLGWTALVGSTLPADVYICEHGRWVATGEVGGSPELPLQSIEENIEKERNERVEADSKLSMRLDSLEDMFPYKNAYVYSYKPETERSGEPDFECTGYLPVEAGMKVIVDAYEHSDVCAPVNYYDSSFRHIGSLMTGSTGKKSLTIERDRMPADAAFFRVNALHGEGKVEFENAARYPVESARLAASIRENNHENEARIANTENLLDIVIEKESVRVNENCYFNLRGVGIGDKVESLIPENTKEEGFTAASLSFAGEAPRLLRLTASGNDMVRAWTALNKDMIVVGIAGVNERKFSDTAIQLPSGTRHLLLESYLQPLSAELYSPKSGSSDPLTRTATLSPRRGVCFDYGSDDIVGNYFRESEIKRVESIPDAAIIVHNYTKGERIVVSMDTGTPNVRGIVYVDSDNKIISCELPLRTRIAECTLNVPERTAKIVFSTYDFTLFPMSVRVERNLVEMLENYISGSSGATGPSGATKVVLFGDSLLERSDALGKTVGDYIAQIAGVEVFNCGIGGARLSARCVVSGLNGVADSNQAYGALDVENLVQAVCGNDLSLQRSAVQYLKSQGDDNSRQLNIMDQLPGLSPDMIFILAGTNDYVSEVSSTDDAIPKAMERIAKVVAEKYPHAVLIFITPPPRQANLADSSTFSDDYMATGAVSLLPDVCRLIVNTAESLHCETIDLYNRLGWNRYNYAAQCSGIDGTHPVKGFCSMAAYIAKFIRFPLS